MRSKVGTPITKTKIRSGRVSAQQTASKWVPETLIQWGFWHPNSCNSSPESKATIWEVQCPMSFVHLGRTLSPLESRVPNPVNTGIAQGGAC